MAPKKKTRGSARTASTPVHDEDPMVIDTPEVEEDAPSISDYDILKDPWTDEQETSLFKGIIRWKPAGMHKHFRMVALSEHLRNHGYDPKVHTHTRIPGIWQKLSTLYNLDVIDDRENSFDFGEDDGAEDKFLEFSLPTEEFGLRMWQQGMDTNTAESSPHPETSVQPETQEPPKKRKRADTTSKVRASTIEDTDEAKTPPPPASAVKTEKTGRGGRRSRGRAKVDSSERQPSKDTTMDEAEDNEEEVEEGGDEEDEEDGGDDEEADDGTPSPKASRSATKGKGGATPARAQSKTRKSRRRK